MSVRISHISKCNHHARTAIALIILSLSLPCFGVGKEVQVEPYRVYHVMITDPGIIQLVRDEQMLDSDLVIDSLEIIDATRNGFGNGDLMVVYPNKQVLPLLQVEGKLRSTMDSWKFSAAHQITSTITDSYSMRNLADQAENVKTAFLADLLAALETVYDDTTIEGYFRRDPETSFIQLWNFNPEALTFRPLRGSGAVDTLHGIDLLKVIHLDTVYIADSTIHDALHLYRNSRSQVLLKQNYANFSIDSEPDSAVVYLDGEKLGVTPLKNRKIPVGEHQLTLLKSYFHPFHQPLSAVHNDSLVISARLLPARGWLSIDTEPADAIIFIDSSKASIGKTPLENLPVQPGSHLLRLTLDGFHLHSEDIEISEGDTLRLNLTLTPIPGVLSVTTQPPGAILLVDGEFAGITPAVLDTILPGYHEIRIEKKWFDPLRSFLQVQPGETKNMIFELPVLNARRKSKRVAVNLALAAPGSGQIVSGQLRGYLYSAAFLGSIFFAYRERVNHHRTLTEYNNAISRYRNSITKEEMLLYQAQSNHARSEMLASSRRYSLFLTAGFTIYLGQLIDTILFGGMRAEKSDRQLKTSMSSFSGASSPVVSQAPGNEGSNRSINGQREKVHP